MLNRLLRKTLGKTSVAKEKPLFAKESPRLLRKTLGKTSVAKEKPWVVKENPRLLRKNPSGNVSNRGMLNWVLFADIVHFNALIF